MNNNFVLGPNPLGILQSRGIGDIIIALPIADYYRDQGHTIYWPICAEFISHFEHTVPWINWIPVPTDRQGAFFYDTPVDYLQQLGVTDCICLYQALSGHPEFSARPEFQIQSFDQYKYSVAGVPFLKKWQLSNCITRQLDRELQLKQSVTDGRPYVVTHLIGSDHVCDLDIAHLIPTDWQIVPVTAHTDCIMDWITTLQHAEAIVAVDSVVANLVDQLGIAQQVDSYFIPRSHIQLSPVLGWDWTILEPSESIRQRISIFTNR